MEYHKKQTPSKIEKRISRVEEHILNLIEMILMVHAKYDSKWNEWEEENKEVSFNAFSKRIRKNSYFITKAYYDKNLTRFYFSVSTQDNEIPEYWDLAQVLETLNLDVYQIAELHERIYEACFGKVDNDF